MNLQSQPLTRSSSFLILARGEPFFDLSTRGQAPPTFHLRPLTPGEPRGETPSLTSQGAFGEDLLLIRLFKLLLRGRLHTVV